MALRHPGPDRDGLNANAWRETHGGTDRIIDVTAGMRINQSLHQQQRHEPVTCHGQKCEGPDPPGPTRGTTYDWVRAKKKKVEGRLKKRHQVYEEIFYLQTTSHKPGSGEL